MAEQRLLWIDNEIQKFFPWVEKFQNHGVHVDTERTVARAFRRIEDAAYDAIFVDAVMPAGRGTQALPTLAAKAKDASLFVCSAYFYLDSVWEELETKERELATKIRRIDKTNLPFLDDEEDVRDFLDGIFDNPAKLDHGRATAQAALLSDDDEIEVHWDDFSRLDMIGKLEVNELVASWTDASRRTSFAEGFVYLVYCGSWSEPLIKRRSVNEFLTDRELLDLARSTSRAPFVFSHGGVADDVTGCSADAGLRGYATIKLEKNGREEEVHFDGGLAHSVLSHEWYTENGWVDRILFAQNIQLGEMSLFGKYCRVEGVIYTDVAAQTVFGNLPAFSVLNWAEHRLAARCGPDCSRGLRTPGLEGVCRFRTGLLGRNVPLELDCDFLMDFRTGGVRFWKRGE